MIGKHIFSPVVLAALCALNSAFAKVDLGTPFTDGVVLQREMPVRIFGTADAGEKVTVEFAGQKVSAKACEKGRWLVELEPMNASKESRVLTVRGSKDAAGVEVKDVLVGEVWFCCGQSNADCAIWCDKPRRREANGALILMKTVKPFVRLVKNRYVWKAHATYDYKAKWEKMTPAIYERWEKEGGLMPSAIGYMFALELANALDIPIGIVDSSWGGTTIEAWTPKSGFATREDLKEFVNYKLVENQSDWKPEMSKGVFYTTYVQPTVLWNGMVAAYAPMAMRGMIWYQGCSNSSRGYCSRMHALYNGWAKEFGNPGMKFYFAQLAPFKSWFNTQLEQARFEKEQPNAAMAVLTDVGNPWDIHPNEKQIVATRLALHALRRDYGFESVRDNSPSLKSAETSADKVVLAFDDVKRWYVYNKDRSLAGGFEIAGEDGKFKPAKVENYVWRNDGEKVSDGNIKGDRLILCADGVAKPVKVRYLYSKPWIGSLYNEACLPLGPFEVELRH